MDGGCCATHGRSLRTGPGVCANRTHGQPQRNGGCAVVVSCLLYSPSAADADGLAGEAERRFRERLQQRLRVVGKAVGRQWLVGTNTPFGRRTASLGRADCQPKGEGRGRLAPPPSTSLYPCRFPPWKHRRGAPKPPPPSLPIELTQTAHTTFDGRSSRRTQGNIRHSSGLRCSAASQNNVMRFIARTICLCHRGICELSICCSWPSLPIGGDAEQPKLRFPVFSRRAHLVICLCRCRLGLPPKQPPPDAARGHNQEDGS